MAVNRELTRSSDHTTHLPADADLESLLAAARPFLRGELGDVDPDLPSLVSVLCSTGAGECYHKHDTFLAHLFGVYRILRLWGAPDFVTRCGLFHSSYSNSYVNLAIFQPDTGRDQVRSIVGAPAERLVHLFCVVSRHTIIHDNLHLRYTDQELKEHLAASQASLDAARAGRTTMAAAMSVDDEPWRKKLRSLVPAGGIVAKHIRTGEPVALARRVVALFILITVADFSDQYTDYHDRLFGNEENGRLEFRGDNWGALWPGSSKPGLCVSAMSRLAAIYNLLVRDEQLNKLLAADSLVEEKADDIQVGDLVIPPLFERCTRVLLPEDEKVARDLYWEAVCSSNESEWSGVEERLKESVMKNPFVGEPHLVLAQVLVSTGRFEEAAATAEHGLRLLLEWGSTWDKRISWEGWVSWGRVLLDKAKQREWPRTAWGIINLGLVDGAINKGKDVHRAVGHQGVTQPSLLGADTSSSFISSRRHHHTGPAPLAAMGTVPGAITTVTPLHLRKRVVPRRLALPPAPTTSAYHAIV